MNLTKERSDQDITHTQPIIQYIFVIATTYKITDSPFYINLSKVIHINFTYT